MQEANVSELVVFVYISMHFVKPYVLKLRLSEHHLLNRCMELAQPEKSSESRDFQIDCLIVYILLGTV